MELVKVQDTIRVRQTDVDILAEVDEVSPPSDMQDTGKYRFVETPVNKDNIIEDEDSSTVEKDKDAWDDLTLSVFGIKIDEKLRNPDRYYDHIRKKAMSKKEADDARKRNERATYLSLLRDVDKWKQLDYQNRPSSKPTD